MTPAFTRRRLLIGAAGAAGLAGTAGAAAWAEGLLRPGSNSTAARLPGREPDRVVHGHTFAITGGGARKDTVIVLPNRTVTVDLDATNSGQWMTHCHNIYHAETGMMTSLAYLA